MLPAGFEPAIPATEWSKNHSLDRGATGIGKYGYDDDDDDDNNNNNNNSLCKLRREKCD